jgi:hypothetical protein
MVQTKEMVIMKNVYLLQYLKGLQFSLHFHPVEHTEKPT